VLATSSHRLRGGHVLVRRPPAPGPVALGVAVESSSVGGEEALVVEVVDPATGTWARLPESARVRLPDGWERATFAGEVDPGEPGAHARVLARLVEDMQPDVELLDAAVLVDGRPVTRLREHDPFTIAVSFRANRRVPVADVGIRLIRVDGVYVFWQSSGHGGGNLVEPLGTHTVSFHFAPNLIGAGEFEVTAYVANGFDPDGNYPYSEVYDRRVQAARFTIEPERREIDYGVLNQRVPVTVEASDAARPLAALAEGE
jgi:hypothetical protein